MLPEELQGAIDREVLRYPPSELKRAAAALSDYYRQPYNGAPSPIRSDLFRCAYVAMRLPGTYGAVDDVIRRTNLRLPEGLELLDLGAGPGTGAWAASLFWGGISRITLMEKEDGFISLGKRLAADSPAPALQQATWIQQNVTLPDQFPPHDIVMASYSFSELSPEDRKNAIRKAWVATRKILLLIEPGTPEGFYRLKEIREQLLGEGAHLIAPCPHARPCPMAANDWCHFSVRVERTKLHRYLKSGELGYEDEKYAYLVAARTPLASPIQNRVIRHPYYDPGKVTLTLCTSKGQTEARTLRKQTKDPYKRARKIEWGDEWTD